jgi:RNA polymerase sigma factor (sigma-70 family)
LSLDELDPSREVTRIEPLPRAHLMDVERAVARLPDGYREVVVLHDIHGHTHREVAELLGIEEGTSKSQLARGRKRLRELLFEAVEGGAGATRKGQP